MKHLVFLFLSTITLFAGSYGALLLEGNCVTCHNYSENISAPSLQLIKQRYLNAFPNKEDFITNMSNWVLSPNKETSLMHDMIDKYELMPELGYEIDTLQKISQYIYENEI